MKKILLLLFILPSLFVQAQRSLEFFSLAKPYSLNLPFQHYTLSLPANMSFRIPDITDNGGFLDIEDNFSFYFSPNGYTLKDGIVFKMDEKGASFMELYITHAPSFFSNTFLQEQRSISENLVKIASIKNAIGESTSYRCEKDEMTKDNYVFYSNQTIYHFVIPHDFPDRAIYEKIIKEIKKGDFKHEIEAYDNIRKKNREDGNFYGVSQFMRLKQIKGISRQNSTFYYPQDEITFLVPKGYYNVDGRKIIERSDNLKEVFRLDRDKTEKPFFSNFFGPKINFNLITWHLNDTISKPSIISRMRKDLKLKYNREIEKRRFIN